MKKYEYIAKILPDGHISIPEAAIKKFGLKSHSRLHISILPVETKKNGLSRLCGKWQGDADGIVQDIYKSRIKNKRSERIKL